MITWRHSIKKYTANEKIRASEVRLISESGEQIGVIPTDKARQIAQERNLDLVLISESATPPVCKLVNYGQFMYQQKKKEKQSKKTAQVSKELKMSPKISEHDYQVRVNQATKFLQKRYKVKMSIFFRGREIVHSSLGEELLKRFIEDIKEYGTSDDQIIKSGKTMIAILNPR